MSTTPEEDDWTNEGTDSLFEAVVGLSDVEGAERFFRDLSTRQEREEMTSRWAVVQQLDAGLPYREIHANSGVSTATITRINQWLRHGTGGYREALDRASSTGDAR